MITENEKEILDALSRDLNRHDFESHAADLLGLKQDTLEHIEHLEEWTADGIPDAGVIFGILPVHVPTSPTVPEIESR